MISKIKSNIKELERRLNKITGKSSSSSKKSDKSGSDTDSSKKTSITFNDIIYMILDMLKILFPQTKLLINGVKITDVSIDMSISCENADKTAMVYTLTAAAIQNTIIFLQQRMNIKIKKIAILPDFTTEQWRQNVFFKVKISPLVILKSLGGTIIKSIKLVYTKFKNKNNKKVV